MLKKIENIAASASFKNNTRLTGDINALPMISGGKSSISDSLSFSSAFKYLSQLKWQLKSLTHTGNDEFLLEFIVDNLTFKTKIEVHDCKASNINYKISNEDAINTSAHKYLINVIFDFDPDVYSEAILNSSTEYLKWLFEKFASYDSILLKNSTDTEINSFFIDGAENNLIYELSLIHRNIIFFVEKVSGEVLSSCLRVVPVNESHENQIKILQINVKL
jgi:hypothetical protein